MPMLQLQQAPTLPGRRRFHNFGPLRSIVQVTHLLLRCRARSEGHSRGGGFEISVHISVCVFLLSLYVGVLTSNVEVSDVMRFGCNSQCCRELYSMVATCRFLRSGGNFRCCIVDVRCLPQKNGEAFVEWPARRVRMPNKSGSKRPCLPSSRRAQQSCDGDGDDVPHQQDLERRTKNRFDGRASTTSKAKGKQEDVRPLVSAKRKRELEIQQDFR